MYYSFILLQIKPNDEEKVLELEAGEETVKKEHLYLNRAQSDSKNQRLLR